MSDRASIVYRLFVVNNISLSDMHKDDFLKLGYKIKYERSKKSLSQLDLSLKTGLTTRTISRIECGTIDPKYSTLVRIAEALEVELVDILSFKL